MELLNRPRRLRGSQILRDMVRETRVSKNGLIYPVFVKEGQKIKEEISAMPGQYRYSLDTLAYELERIQKSGVRGVLFFGIPEHKDACGSGAWAQEGIVQKAVELAKREFPDLYLITDVCLCEYTSHGHCGLLHDQTVDNDSTLELLTKTSLSHVQAGADMVAPSDMMDGRILAIRKTLDGAGYINTPIMSYAVKYSSSFYGPFRDAAGSAPAFGDRKSYQMDYHNKREAIKEAELDLAEGADILMVKPGLAYLDIVKEISERFPVPCAVYSVSGEYSMIKAAAMAGYIDEAAVVSESAVSMFRAGADILISYYAKEIAGYIEEGRIG